MNSKSYKTIFSKRLGCLVAVGEHTTSQGKANGASCAAGTPWGGFVGVLAVSFAAVSLAWAAPANNALPTGGQVAQGGASISTSGATMNIQQTTAKAVVNWNSFDIGKDARVNIVQPGADSVILNRVTGANPSQIFGQLNANGQVVLVNPNGVLFGRDGSVTATSFTASTLGITDANFMSGNMQFERNGSTAGVVNQGSIRANGGYVALLGASVSNEGRIETNGGTAYLAAAEAVRIPVSGSGRIKLELSPAQINARVANTKEGTIVTQGGQVYMQAAALQDAVASIVQSGAIDTTGEQGGAVHLLTDGGQIKVDGSITANSTGKDNQNQPRKGGDIIIGRDEETGVLARYSDVSGARLESHAGFVETSADVLKTDGVRVHAADWLLDPYNIVITNSVSGTAYSDPNSGGVYNYTPSATSNILASDIQTSLNNGTNVKISTGLTGSLGSDAGNITVASNISKTSGGAATLTLEANNSITINSGVSITDSGASTRNLGIQLTANGVNGTSTSNAVRLQQNAQIDVGGAVNIDATKTVGGGLNGAAVYLSLGTLNSAQNNGGSRTLIRGGSLTINMALSGTNTWGVFGQHATGLEATAGDLRIAANYSGAASSSGSAVYFGSGWSGSYAPASSYLRASNAAVNIQATTAGTAADGVMNFTGSSISARNDIVLKAQMTDATKTGINVASEFNNPSINSSIGDVLMQTNRGAIRLAALTNGAVTGNNITIDNTGSALVRDANGNYIKGTGTYTGTSGASVGIAGSGTGIQASGNLDIVGVGSAAGSLGVILDATALSGSRVSIQAENLGKGDGTTNGMYSNGSITSTVSDVFIRGLSQKDNALSLQGAITGKTDVRLVAQSGDVSSVAAGPGLFLNKTVTAQTGDIAVTATTTSGSNFSANLASGASLVTSASGKSITINADTLQVDTSATPASINAGANSTVSIRPATESVAIDLGGADVRTPGSNVLGLSNAELGRITAGQLNIGSASSGNMSVSNAVTTADSTGHVVLTTGGNLAINAALQTGTTGTKNLTLNLAGSGSATQAAALKTSNLELLGSNASYTLNNTSNDAATLAATVKSLGYTDANALTVGSVGSSTGISGSGIIAVATQTGNLTVNQAISTSDTSASAIVLNAGLGSSAGTASGGDIQLGGSYGFSTGTGGRTTLFTGNTVNSTLTSLLGSGSGRFRYNSDESTTSYTAALGSGLYAIYRQAPSLSVQLNSQTKTYDGLSHSGGNGFVTTGSLLNGDLDAGVSVVYSGTSQGARNAGSYTLLGTASSSLGYSLTTTGSTLAINRANLTVTANAVTKTYDGTLSATGTGTVGTLAGAAAGETVNSAGSQAFLDKNAGTGKTVRASGVTVKDSANNDVTGNYNISYVDNTASVIQQAALTVTANAVTKTYDGTLSATGTGTVGTLAGAAAGETVNSAGSQAFLDKNAGTGKTVRASGVTVKDSANNDVTGNYNISYVDNTASVIQQAALTATLQGSAEKVYDGTTNATLAASNYLVTGWVSGEGATVNQTQASYADKNVSGNSGSGTVTAWLADTHYTAQSGTSLSNYILPAQASGNIGKITPAALTIKVNDSAVFVTQDADTANHMGYSYTGFVGAENASGALSFEPTSAHRTYLGATRYPLVGQYAGVLGMSAVPVARDGNYSVTVQNGTLTVVPVDKLLITVQSQSDVYGNRTAANAGQASQVMAQYCVVTGGVCNAVSGLTMSQGAGNGWSGTDNTGSSVQFETTVSTDGNLSQGGYLNAGNYTYGVRNVVLQSPGNFLRGSAVNGGVLTVDRLALPPAISGVTKVYDGTQTIPMRTFDLQGVLRQDAVFLHGSGEYAQRHAGTGLGYTIRNMTLSGADQNNYAFAGGLTSFSGNDGVINPAVLKITSSDVVKTYDGTRSAQGSAVVTGGTQLFGSDSISGGQFAFASRDAGVGNRRVAVSGVVVSDGNGGQNYNVEYVDNTTSTINKADASVSATPTAVTYNGQIQTQSAPTSSGFVVGDAIRISGAASGRNAGTYRSALSVDGADASNYNISITNADLVIGKASASVIGTATKLAYNGQIQTQNAPSTSGFVSGDDILVTGLARGRDMGTYMSSLAVEGRDAANYDVRYSNADLVIAASHASPDSVNPLQPWVNPSASQSGNSVQIASAQPAVAALQPSPGTSACSTLETEQCDCDETEMAEVQLCLVRTGHSMRSIGFSLDTSGTGM